MMGNELELTQLLKMVSKSFIEISQWLIVRESSEWADSYKEFKDKSSSK